MPERSDLAQGTLDLLILQVVAAGAIHGYAIAQRFQLISLDPERLSIAGLAFRTADQRSRRCSLWALSRCIR